MKGIVAVLLIVMMLSGCAGKSGNSKNLSNPESTSTPVMAPVPVPDVAIKARAKGDTVYIHIKNNARKSLGVSPYFFALIIDNKRPEIRFDPSLANAELPTAKLPKGMEVSGRIQFFNYDNLVDQKLVFNSPDYKPMMIFIEEFSSE